MKGTNNNGNADDIINYKICDFVITTEDDVMICKYCRQTEDYCDEIIFGDFLIHDLTDLSNKVQGHFLTEDQLKLEYVDRYHRHLRFNTWREYGDYDNCDTQRIPDCMLHGSFKQLKHMMKTKEKLHIIESKKVYNATGLHRPMKHSVEK